MEAGRSVVHKHFIYFAPFGGELIYKYHHSSPESKPRWSTINEPMKWLNPGLAIIGNQVVTIGGRSESECTNQVWTWSDINKDWEQLSSMTHERSDPGVITTTNYVTVISGKGMQNFEDNWINFVEVYHKKTRKWYEVCPLPSPYTGIEVTLCRDTLYVFPDQYRQGVKCNLHDLICKVENCPWKTFKNCPLRYSTPVTVKDHVVCIGGAKVEGDGLKDIYLYKETSDSWDKIGDLKSGRMYSMVEVCDNKLFVVGGVSKLTDERLPSKDMEIYTLN